MEENQPTPEPTPEPTQAPTVAPSPEVTPAPTEEPIIVPDISNISYSVPHNPRMARVIAGGVIAVVTIAGLGIALKALGNSQKAVNVTPSESSTNKSENVEIVVTESEKQALVKNVLADIKSAIASVDANSIPDSEEEDIATSIQDVYDTNSPLYIPSSAKVAIPLEKSFGLQISASRALMGLMADQAKAKLSELGFVEYQDVKQNLSGDYGYIDKENNILCGAFDANTNIVTFSCGHTSWISPEKIALANSLAEAYKEKQGDYPVMISASAEDIKNSPYQPYQKLTVTLGNAAGLFYRSDKSASWVFFAATQAPIPCEKYYEDSGARHAFQGEKCLDKSGSVTEVSEKN
ncbi:hypothetical protein IJU22_00015 [Candidatus Saccharibacteria bacterium]|nr:hypothetical protein [Candidatus Saccharibacteria bacterium]